MSYAIHRKRKVRDGYYVTATLTSGDDSRAKTFFVLSEKEPSDLSLEPKLTKFVDNFAEELPAAYDEKIATMDIEEILYKKRYLEKGQTLADLPTGPLDPIIEPAPKPTPDPEPKPEPEPELILDPTEDFTPEQMLLWEQAQIDMA